MNLWKYVDRPTLLMVKNLLLNRRNKASFLATISLVTLLSSGFKKDEPVPVINSNEIYKEQNQNPFLDEFYAIMDESYNKSLEEKQEDFLTKYDIDYQELIKAVTPEVWNVDYKDAHEIEARPDFSKIKQEFNSLTNKKVDYILKRYNITYENLGHICQVIERESGGFNYNEAYHTISTLINRTHDLAWVNAVSKDFGENGGFNIYNQLTYRNHYACDFIPERFLEFTNWIGYYAVLDALVSEKVSHEYTEFASSSYEDGIKRVQLETGGNKYCHKVKNWIENPTLNEVNYTSPRIGKAVLLRLKTLEDIGEMYLL